MAILIKGNEIDPSPARHCATRGLSRKSEAMAAEESTVKRIATILDRASVMSFPHADMTHGSRFHKSL